MDQAASHAPSQAPAPAGSPPRRRVVIDLGCGRRKKPGAIGLDLARVPGVDILADVTRPLPLRDNSVDEVYASHLVEHVDDLLAFMGEVWRVCRPGALVYFRFPHGSTPFLTWKDPTHRRGVYLATFEYFDPTTLDGQIWGYYHPAKFKIERRRLHFNLNFDTVRPGRTRALLGFVFDWLANRNERWQYVCERFWGHFVGMEEAEIWLRALKPGPAEG
ncbi:class I SAM-dependent methyltransferase [Tepidiforma sp.]|uniref:class I SAM-dependent methyltransferase n=1 Tax=Tepidiforma sp. TaxID=2682230 RepID=UPI002ADE5EA7|nr:class I SAM-dependent methyltransferase [Tepidiforma sp.]